ncbi:MAG: hypothetical protein WBQ89_18455, partial [Candidatus Acidiferrum sp.]
TMAEDKFEQLMSQHGFKKTHSGLATVKFEKKDLIVETRDSGETFIVKNASHIQTCPNIGRLTEYLGTLPSAKTH